MKFKFKKDAKIQGSTAGFWYDLTDGGYIDLKAVLKDTSQIEKLEDAICLLADFEVALLNNNLLIE